MDLYKYQKLQFRKEAKKLGKVYIGNPKKRKSRSRRRIHKGRVLHNRNGFIFRDGRLLA